MMMRWVSPAVVALTVIGLGVHRFPGLVVALALAGVANGEIQPAANRYSRVRPVAADRDSPLG